MDVKTAIETRRAYRALAPCEVTDEILAELAGAAGLAPSCFNNQPWRLVFVRSPQVLEALHGALSKSNAWMRGGSLIIAVHARREDDCLIKDREYYLFDAGLAAAQLMLRATELGLVAHPVAGFDEVKAKEILGIPPESRLITLLAVGRHAPGAHGLMTEDQIQREADRPARKAPEEFVTIL